MDSTHSSTPSSDVDRVPRVVFGSDSLLQLAGELTHLGISKVLLVGTRGMGERSGAHLVEAARSESVDFFEAESQRVFITTGMNSIAHAVEALYSTRLTPWAPLLAEQALAAQRDALAAISRGNVGTEARVLYLYGGFLGGWLVATCGIALHHHLCHVIGGLFQLPHGDTNSVVLPHVVAF